jgi:hypothetical protein
VTHYIRRHPAGGYVRRGLRGPTEDPNEARLYSRHQKAGLQVNPAYYSAEVVAKDRASWVPVRVTVEIAE